MSFVRYQSSYFYYTFYVEFDNFDAYLTQLYLCVNCF